MSWSLGLDNAGRFNTQIVNSRAVVRSARFPTPDACLLAFVMGFTFTDLFICVFNGSGFVPSVFGMEPGFQRVDTEKKAQINLNDTEIDE